MMLSQAIEILQKEKTQYNAISKCKMIARNTHGSKEKMAVC
jgi:hypothetical protein